MLSRLLLLAAVIFATVSVTMMFVGKGHFGAIRVYYLNCGIDIESRENSAMMRFGRLGFYDNSIYTFYFSNSLRDNHSKERANMVGGPPGEIRWFHFFAFESSVYATCILFGVPHWFLGGIWLAIAIGLAIITRVRFSVRDMLVLTAVCAGSISLCHYNPMPVIALSVIALPLLAVVLFARCLVVPGFRLAAGRFAQ